MFASDKPSALYSCEKGRPGMINLGGIGHVLLRVADEEASKRFYRDVLGFRVAEQDPERGGVFMTLGDGFHTIDLAQHPAPRDVPRPKHGQLGLAHIAFKGRWSCFPTAVATKTKCCR
jgi:catechol-2,3-dioxygenase